MYPIIAFNIFDLSMHAVIPPSYLEVSVIGHLFASSALMIPNSVLLIVPIAFINPLLLGINVFN